MSSMFMSSKMCATEVLKQEKKKEQKKYWKT